MLSYAQNSEDVLLSRIFKEDTGTYVDVGACHPIIDSVTYAFYERGWSGINFEPTQAMFSRLEAVRPRDINLNLAISNENGSGVFYECPGHLPLSTMDPVIAGEIRQSGGILEERPIDVKNLATVLMEQDVSKIDFLKIDVEGHELEVLSGNDWEKFRPTAIVIESTHPRSITRDYDRWEQIILDAGYLYATFDGLNRYYLKQEESHLLEDLSRPLSVFDKHVTLRQFAQMRFLRDTARKTLKDSEPVTGEDLVALLESMVENPMLCLESPVVLADALKKIISNR